MPLLFLIVKVLKINFMLLEDGISRGFDFPPKPPTIKLISKRSYKYSSTSKNKNKAKTLSDFSAIASLNPFLGFSGMVAFFSLAGAVF